MRRRPVTVSALLAALIAPGCGGGGSGPRPADQARNYTAAEAAFVSGDYDRAIGGFEALGGYRDAPRRLAEVRHAAGEALLANARRKLRAGHPRAAVALAQTATGRYGEDTPAARALLRQAQQAQVVHHQQQVAGKAPG